MQAEELKQADEIAFGRNQTLTKEELMDKVINQKKYIDNLLNKIEQQEKRFDAMKNRASLLADEINKSLALMGDITKKNRLLIAERHALQTEVSKLKGESDGDQEQEDQADNASPA